MAQTSLKATPTPASIFAGEGQSGRLGSTTGLAGISPVTSWWSVITISIPRPAAYLLFSAAVMPQSTVITRLTPFFAIASRALFFTP